MGLFLRYTIYMISRVKGVVIDKTLKYAVIEVSGLGYKVFTTLDTLSEIKKEEVVELWTYLAVRENALDLYGFILRDELDFFELLIGISGIGPRGAMGILSSIDVGTLTTAISSGDISYLTKVSGIGKKSAEKIVLELRDKVSVIGDAPQSIHLKEESESIEALKALGYKHEEARDALKQVPADVTGISERVREALRMLGK